MVWYTLWNVILFIDLWSSCFYVNILNLYKTIECSFRVKLLHIYSINITEQITQPYSHHWLDTSLFSFMIYELTSVVDHYLFRREIILLHYFTFLLTLDHFLLAFTNELSKIFIQSPSKTTSKTHLWHIDALPILIFPISNQLISPHYYHP